MCNWKKWIWPGIFAVVILTALSTWFKADTVQNDLTAKALEKLSEEHSWASVSLDGRDLTLSGTSPSPEDTQAALEIADNAYDVRIVSDGTELLASASPYPLSISRDATNLTLTGNVPNNAVRAEIVEAVQAAIPDATIDDQTTLARGQGETFVDLAKFGIGELAGLSTGTMALSDTDFSIEGTATSFDTFNSVTAKMAGEIPASGNLVKAEITPPAASPYEWMADYDGIGVTLSGFVPNSQASASIEASVKEQLPNAEITNELQVAAGAPDAFVDAAQYATGFFPGFTQGRASFSDNAFSISGVAKSPADFETATGNLANLTAGFELAENNIQPVGVSPYVWGATKTPETIVLSGSAPGTAIRERIEASAAVAFPDATIDNQLEIAGGETAQYQPATEYSIDMLKKFVDGEARLVDNNLEITGRAKTIEDYDAILAEANNGPEGISVNASPLPPIVNPYRFTAEKADNQLTLSGFVPDENARTTAVDVARSSNPGFSVVDELKIAEGISPGVNWATATGFGLSQLATLDDGKMSIIDANYSISGSAASIEVRNSAVQSIEAGIPGGLTLASEAITAPAPEPEPEPEPVVVPEPVAAPVADPYSWTLSKLNSGVSVSGNVADKDDGDAITAIVKSSLGVSEVTDTQTIASGKPESFDVVRRIVTNQVKRLEAGRGRIIGQDVSVNGRASSEAIANEITATITNALPAGFSGSTNIVFPQPAPAPEPVAAPTVDADACQALIMSAIDGKKVLFETNKALIKPDSEALLDAVAKAASECPSVRMIVAGHTDSRGRDAFNQELSEARANAVKDYLTNKGIDAGRMDAKGFGETQPIASNRNSDGRAQNRRIEFNVIK